jgi:hypothetical protein
MLLDDELGRTHHVHWAKHKPVHRPPPELPLGVFCSCQPPLAGPDHAFLNSDPIHQRFQSEINPVSPEPLFASDGPRDKEPRTAVKPTTPQISESPDMGRALTKRVNYHG